MTEAHLKGRLDVKPQPGNNMIRPLFMVLVLLVFLSAPAHGQDSIDLDTQQLRVWVAPPFVMRGGAGGYDGLAIRLWDAVAAEMGSTVSTMSAASARFSTRPQPGNWMSRSARSQLKPSAKSGPISLIRGFAPGSAWRPTFATVVDGGSSCACSSRAIS